MLKLEINEINYIWVYNITVFNISRCVRVCIRSVNLIVCLGVFVIRDLLGFSLADLFRFELSRFGLSRFELSRFELSRFVELEMWIVKKIVLFFSRRRGGIGYPLVIRVDPGINGEEGGVGKEESGSSCGVGGEESTGGGGWGGFRCAGGWSFKSPITPRRKTLTWRSYSSSKWAFWDATESNVSVFEQRSTRNFPITEKDVDDFDSLLADLLPLSSKEFFGGFLFGGLWEALLEVCQGGERTRAQ